jgi:hypothetical protein
MGVPNSEVGYTSATTRRGDREVHKRHVVALGKNSVVTYQVARWKKQLSADQALFNFVFVAGRYSYEWNRHGGERQNGLISFFGWR